MGNSDATVKKRIIYLDILRILASFAVIILHVSAQNWYDTDVSSFAWQTFNFYDSIVRWAVPVFIMVSGASILSGEKTTIAADNTRYIYQKVRRIVTAFIFWSFLYAAVGFAKGGSIKSFVAHLLEGHYHMWFLFLIAGLYLIIPFLSQIARSDRLTRYFFALSVFFTFLIPHSIRIVSLFSESMEYCAEYISKSIDFHFTLGGSCYFLLGYFLQKAQISRKWERVIYAAGLFGFLETVCLSAWASLSLNRAVGFYDPYDFNVLLESVAVFVFVKMHFPEIRSGQRKKAVLFLSKRSFGAYLIHALVIEQLDDLAGFNTLSFCPAFSIPVIGVLVFAISYLASAVLNRIPFFRKYVV